MGENRRPAVASRGEKKEEVTHEEPYDIIFVIQCLIRILNEILYSQQYEVGMYHVVAKQSNRIS